LNCSAGSEARFRVLAEDHGHPRLSATADVQVDLIDSEAPPPLFDKPLYEVQVREDAEIGECLVQVNICLLIISVLHGLLDALRSFEQIIR
jgi:hypothetical protein